MCRWSVALLDRVPRVDQKIAQPTTKGRSAVRADQEDLPLGAERDLLAAGGAPRDCGLTRNELWQGPSQAQM